MAKFLARNWVVNETAVAKYFAQTFLNEDAPIATITGTTLGATESQVVAAVARTIIITLTGDTWVASGSTFEAQRQNIIDGLDSAQVETLGWNNEVRDTMTVARVVRTSPTVVTITLHSSETTDYKVVADEVITVTIPATALVLAVEMTGQETVDITAECDQTLAPGTIITQTNLTGSVTDIDEPVGSPDANWLIFNPP